METSNARVMFKTRRVPAWPKLKKPQPSTTLSQNTVSTKEEPIVTERNTIDPVNQPSHYCTVEGLEAKDMIQAVLNEHPELSPWEGYCLGNFLKYRFRLGDKDDIDRDLGKSNVYRDWFNTSRTSPIPEHSHHFYDRERNK